MSSFDPHRNLHTRQAEEPAKNTTWAWIVGGCVAVLLMAGLYAMSGNGTYLASDTPRPQNNVTTPTTGAAPQSDATRDQSSTSRPQNNMTPSTTQGPVSPSDATRDLSGTRGSPASSPQGDVPPTMNVDPQTTK